MNRTGRRVAIAGVLVVAVLAVAVTALWAFQRRLIYLPDTTPVPDATRVFAGAPAGATDVILHTEDGLDLGAWYLPAPAAGCRATVLVSPGNAGNRFGRAQLAQALRAEGFGVLLMDYRGYGGNPGNPTESGLAADARAGYDFLTGRAGLAPGEIIYFGESLGAAVVTRLATDHPPAALLLRSPFTELADVARRQFPFLPVRLLLRDRFPVADLVGGIRVPVAVVYGSADSVVPPELSRRVAESAGGPVRVVVVDGADHNDPALATGPEVIAAVVDLADRAGCRPAD